MPEDNYKVTYIFVCDECGYTTEENASSLLPDGWVHITVKYIMCPECVAE